LLAKGEFLNKIFLRVNQRIDAIIRMIIEGRRDADPAAGAENS